MKKTILITVIIMALSIMLFAQQKPMKMMKDDCPDCGQMQMKGPMQNNYWDRMSELKLTPEQQKKIDALRDEHKKYLNLKEATLQNLRIDKQNAMQTEDYAKVKTLNKNISDLELEIANKQVDHHQAMMKELTPEQKELLKQHMGNGMGMGRDKPRMDDGKPMMQHHKGMK
jgi:Spy/CpxP family protein refolding chaperone